MPVASGNATSLQEHTTATIAQENQPTGEPGESAQTDSPTTTKCTQDAVNPSEDNMQRKKRPHSTVSEDSDDDMPLGNSRFPLVDDFTEYLRCSADYCSELSDELWKSFKADLRDCKNECEMYVVLAKLFTHICIAVCMPGMFSSAFAVLFIDLNILEKDTDRCLAMFITAERNSIPFRHEEYIERPSLVFKWTTFKVAKEIINSEYGKPRAKRAISWHEVVSYVETKILRNPQEWQCDKASKCCNQLPQEQSDLAGMYYGVVSPKIFILYWGDTSCIVRSKRYVFDDLDDWAILFHYVATLVNPLPELPLRDSTMKYKAKTDCYEIKCVNRLFKDCKLLSWSTGQSKQTCIFSTDSGKRVVKDIWVDQRMRTNEGEILEELKGVRGVVQIDTHAEVVNPHTRNPLQTYESDSESLDEAPVRTKNRYVLKSSGKPLGKSRSVLQIIKAVHDSLRGDSLLICDRT